MRLVRQQRYKKERPIRLPPPLSTETMVGGVRRRTTTVAESSSSAEEEEEYEALIPGLPDDVAISCFVRAPHTALHTLLQVSAACRGLVKQPSFHLLRRSLRLSRSLLVLSHLCSRSYVHLTLLDPLSSSWDSLPPIPGHRLPFFCQLAGAAHPTPSLVVVGGWDPLTWDATKAVFVYDLLTSTWREGAPMPGPSRSFFACAASDRHPVVFVAGGHDEGKHALSSALAYDVALDVWLQLPDMSSQRDGCRGLFRRGRFQVVGGHATEMQERFSTSSEEFDPRTWRWRPKEEHTLEAGLCPRTCATGPAGRLFGCRSGVLAVAGDGGAWRDVAEVPCDASVTPLLTEWGSTAVVLGVRRHGQPLSAYILEEAAEEKYRWRKVDAPPRNLASVHSACCVEI